MEDNKLYSRLQGIVAVLIGLVIVIAMNLEHILKILQEVIIVLNQSIQLLPNLITQGYTFLIGVSNGILYLFGIILIMFGIIKILNIEFDVYTKRRILEGSCIFIILLVFIIITFNILIPYALLTPIVFPIVIMMFLLISIFGIIMFSYLFMTNEELFKDR